MTTGAPGGVELLRNAISGFGDSHPEAVRHYRKGDRVIEQGTPSDGFFLIIKGTVNILYRKDSGTEEQITLRWEHDLVGETAFVRPHALRTASVEVASDVSIYVDECTTSMVRPIEYSISGPHQKFFEKLGRVYPVYQLHEVSA